MPARQSLRAFLATARAALASPTAQRPLTIVVGNESADLDSLCSALVFAYLRTHTPPYTLHIPLSNLPREDLKLRREMTAVLQHAGLKPKELLTLSDLPDGAAALKPEDSRWLLVDHNSLTGQLEKYSGSVVGCVDHHADEKTVPAECGGEPRIIEKSGSCTSLVIECCRDAWDALSREQDAPRDAAQVDEHLALIALGAIFSDTAKLTSQHKVTEKDTRAVEFLEGKLRGGEYDRNAYYKEISQIKEDISGMSFRDVLRKDYKEWKEGCVHLGISSIMQGLGHLIELAGSKDQFFIDLRDWAGERNLDVVAIMTVVKTEDSIRRELLVWGLNDRGLEAAETFEAESKEELALHTWGNWDLDGVNGLGWRKAWHQGTIQCSRKQVAPLLRRAMKG